MKKSIQGIGAVAAMAVAFSAFAGTAFAGKDKENFGKYQVGDLRTGYTFSTPETRAIQDDDFENPAFLWVDVGEALWNKKEGKAGKSCASCHDNASVSMRGVGARYPVFNKKLGKMQNLEQRINQERKEKMQAKPLKYESKQLLGHM